MKLKQLKPLFVCLLACYFFMAGTGYNVVNYCCQTCADKGIEAVATSSCNDVHQHLNTKRTQHNEDITCENLSHQPESCHLLRINTDIPSFNDLQIHFGYQIYSIDLFSENSNYFTESIEISSRYSIPPPGSSILKTGRSILISKVVLLI